MVKLEFNGVLTLILMLKSSAKGFGKTSNDSEFFNFGVLLLSPVEVNGIGKVGQSSKPAQISSLQCKRVR